MNVLDGSGLVVRIRQRMALVRWTLCGVSFNGQWVISNGIFHRQTGGALVGVSGLESADG